MVNSVVLDLEQRPISPDQPPVGFLATWSLTNCKVQRGALDLALTAAGLHKYLPPAPSTYLVTRHALEQFAADHRVQGTDERTLVRGNQKNGPYAEFAVVAEHLEGFTYQVNIRVRLEKATGTITCVQGNTGPLDLAVNDPALSAAIQPYIDRNRNLFLTSDVATMLAHILTEECKAINIGHDGTYFVPQSSAALIQSLKTVVAQIPATDPYLSAIPILNSVQGRQESAKGIHDGFLAQLARMQTDLDDLAKCKQGTVRPATVGRRLKQYQDVAERAEFYRDLLQIRADEILDKVKGLRIAAKAVLLSDAVADDQPAPAPLPLPEAA